MSAIAKTADIKNEFSNLVDDDTVYTLQELKAILSDVFKTKNKKVSKSKKNSKKSENSDEETSPPKTKKSPNSYNIYVKEKMPEFKKDHPDTPATELMSLIGASWKSLSIEEKDAYKLKVTAKSDSGSDNE